MIGNVSRCDTIGTHLRGGHHLDVRIRQLTNLTAKNLAIAENAFFEGGIVGRCQCGRFHFGVGVECIKNGIDRGGGGKLIEINEGETIIIYPHQRVTVRALEPKNVLMFVVLEGASVADYFDLFGFCNGMHGRTSCQHGMKRDEGSELVNRVVLIE